MNEQIEMFKWLLVAALGVWALILLAIFIYLCWLYLKLKTQLRARLRGPQVARDGAGRPLKERL